MDIINNIFKFLIEGAYSITGDFGIAIVLLTIGVKLILLPLNIKQKIAMKKQLEFSKEIETVKGKYKNKKRQEEEIQKLAVTNKNSLLGCFLPFLQLPIISGLYMAISGLHLEVATILVPWVFNIGTFDNKYLIPLIYALVSILPSLLSYLNIFKGDGNSVSLKAMIPMVLFGVIITIKAPVALGIYFITSGFCTLIEDIGFKIYNKRKAIA